MFDEGEESDDGVCGGVLSPSVSSDNVVPFEAHKALLSSDWSVD